jgi:hypothetical protein
MADQSPPQKQQAPPPRQPAQGQPQPAQAIDFAKLQQILQTLGTYGPTLYMFVVKLAEIFQQRQPVMQAAAAVKCGPDGEEDHSRCCHACLEHLLAATAICLHDCHVCDHGGDSA